MTSQFEATLIDAIENDKLVVAIVTSDTQGKYQNEGTPFGAGKTTIALQLAHKFSYYDIEKRDFLNIGHDSWQNPDSWDSIFGQFRPDNQVPTKSLWYWPVEINRAVRAVNKAMTKCKICQQDRESHYREHRIKVGVWDAVQASAPSKQGTSDALVNLFGMLSEERPSIGILILTAPNINSIASPIRGMVKYELICFERGLYEVQKIIHRKDFHNPGRDQVRLKPIEGISREEAEAMGEDIDNYRVPPLPAQVKQRYEMWRAYEKEFRFEGLDKQLLRHDQLSKYEEDARPQTEQAQAQSNSGRALAMKRWNRG